MRRERHPAGTTSPADSRAAEGLQFRVLGPLDVIDANTPIIVPPGRQTLLLSALLTEVGVAVGRHRLVQVLWPEELPADPRNALQHYIARLRSILGPPAVRTVGDGYLLDVAPHSIDAVRFEQLVRRAASLLGGDAGTALAEADAALTLWRAEPYADAHEAPFAVAERARLTALRDLAEDTRIDALLARGDSAAVLPSLMAATTKEPTRERRWAQLMLALYRAGQPVAALDAYRRVRKQLSDQL